MRTHHLCDLLVRWGIERGPRNGCTWISNCLCPYQANTLAIISGKVGVVCWQPGQLIVVAPCIQIEQRVLDTVSFITQVGKRSKANSHRSGWSCNTLLMD